MRTADLVFAFPAIILAMVVTAALGPSLRNAVLALVVVSWPSYARVVRGLVLSVGPDGVRDSDPPARRVRPAAPSSATCCRTSLGPVLVLATLDLGNAVLLLAGPLVPRARRAAAARRSGAPASPRGRSTSSTGGSARSRASRSSRAVLAFNFLGDSLRDVLDPQSSWRAGGEGE